MNGYFYYEGGILKHHGIKGQHWGIRNGPPYPLDSGVDKNPYGLSRGDKAYNLEKWGNSPNNNVLYITGYSGSGKSTLARKLSSNSEHVELDHYMDNPYYGKANKAFDAYLRTNNPNWYSIQKNYSIWDNKIFVKKNASQAEKDYFWNARDQILSKDIPGFAREQYGKNRVIAEGIQIMHPDDWGLAGLKTLTLNDKPVIIKGTSALTSSIRGGRRDYLTDISEGSKVTTKNKLDMTIGRYNSPETKRAKKDMSGLRRQLRTAEYDRTTRKNLEKRFGNVATYAITENLERLGYLDRPVRRY